MNRLWTRLRNPAVRHLPAALATAAIVEIGVRTLTLPRLCRLLGVTIELGPPRAADPTARLPQADAARYRAACRVMHAWPFGGEGKCLRISLVAGALLRRRGPRLRLGVARTVAGTAAHAWIEVDGIVVDPTARNYTVLVTP